MKQDPELQLVKFGAGAENHPGVQYKRLETPVHDQITSRVRNSIQIEAGGHTSIVGSYVFLTKAHQASGLETMTAPSSGPENAALSPEEISVSTSPIPASSSPRIAGKDAGHRSKINVLDVD